MCVKQALYEAGERRNNGFLSVNTGYIIGDFDYTVNIQVAYANK